MNRLAAAIARSRKAKRKPSPLTIAAHMPQRTPVDSVTLVLSVPPSVNRLWCPNGHGGMRRTAFYEQWIDDAGRRLIAQRPGRVAGPYRLNAELPDHVPGDADNRVKALCDVLQKHGVIDNDRLAQDVRIVRAAGPEFRVTITRIEA